ncbi:unnamed protein product [Closterium sp. NIES-54]
MLFQSTKKHSYSPTLSPPPVAGGLASTEISTTSSKSNNTSNTTTTQSQESSSGVNGAGTIGTEDTKGSFHLSSLRPSSLQLSSLSTDLFASVAVTAQLGMFERALFDHTLFNATLTCGSLSAAGYNLSQPASATSAPAPDATSAVASGATSAGWRREERGAPTLSLSFQQQIFGPVRGRWDACMGVDAKAPLAAPSLLDSTYALDCSLERLGAARLVVWYSPTRREGMAEVRLLDR